jgi:hypothetical protein
MKPKGVNYAQDICRNIHLRGLWAWLPGEPAAKLDVDQRRLCRRHGDIPGHRGNPGQIMSGIKAVICNAHLKHVNRSFFGVLGRRIFIAVTK